MSMKCNKCLTEVRFSAKDELFFFTPEGQVPCEECKAMFGKIKNWADNMRVDLPLQVAAELNHNLEKLKTIVETLENTKKRKDGWFRFK